METRSACSVMTVAVSPVCNVSSLVARVSGSSNVIWLEFV